MSTRSVWVAFVAAAALTAGCSDGARTPTAPASAAPALAAQMNGPIASTAAPDRSTAKYEQQFMTSMIDHHQMAIEMAELCLDRAVHRQLVKTCESIIATQSAEVRQMQTWLQEWYGVSYAPQMKPREAREVEALASLTGEAFEIRFMEMMIQHHRAAVRDAEECVRTAYHPELVQLCENIIAAQTAEIEQFEQWLCQWYARCGGSR